MANSCVPFLNKSDNFRAPQINHSHLLKIWERFALTHPELEMSIESQKVLFNYFHEYSLEIIKRDPKITTSDKTLTKISVRIHELMESERDQLYTRFENSKKLIATDVKSYQKEISDIKLYIETLTAKIEAEIEHSIRNMK